MGEDPHDGLAPDGLREAGGECAPPVNGWPSGAETARPPPRSRRGAAPGDQRGTTPPLLPPLPPRPADSQRPARGTAALHPPRQARGGTPPLPPPGGPRHPGRGATAAASAAVRHVPPVSRPPTPAVPAAGRQPCAGAQGHPVGRNGTAALGRGPKQCGGRSTDEATRLGARPGRAEEQTAARRPSCPPPRGALRPREKFIVFSALCFCFSCCLLLL